MKFSLFSVSDYYPDVQTDPTRFLEEQVELIQIAEEYGYYAYFNAEHHFHEYGLVPDPAVLFAAAAMKSSKIMLGPAVSLLTFHNPLLAAEQWAMVDQLSRGRLILGVGSGYLMHEFEGFSMSPAQKRERFDETLAIMELALKGERFSYDGQFYNCKNVRLNLTTYQSRKLEIAIAVLSEVASYYIGKRGYQIMTIPYATVDNVDELKPIYDNYRKGWKESGNAGNGEILAAVHTHVGDQSWTDSALGRKHLEKYVFSRLYARHASYEECIKRGVVAIGNPDEVTAALQRLINTGVDHLMFIFNFGAMPLSEVRNTMKRMKSDVLPRLKDAPK